MEPPPGPAASPALTTILAPEFQTTAKLMELAPINSLVLPIMSSPYALEQAIASSHQAKLLEFVEPAMQQPPHAVVDTLAKPTTPA